MKNANEINYTCKVFRSHIRAYIDGEISGKIKKYFLDHASECEICRNALNEMVRVKKLLSGLPTVKTSSEFDFRLKARLHLEEKLLQNPFYRTKLFFNEHIKYFFAVPAFAILIFSVALLYNDSINQNNIMISNDLGNGVELISEIENNADEIIYIYYVLEKVNKTDDEIGIFLDNNHHASNQSQTIKPVNLISF